MTIHSIQQRIFSYFYLLRFTSIHNIDGNSKMICTADRMKHVLYVLRELNIYYMSEITKIWAETRSSLNIWSWIERACLNDKDSEPASKTDNDWSRHRARHSKWVCYNDKSIVDLLIESVIKQKTSSIERDRHERNKLYYMRVVGTNGTTLLHACSRRESEDTSWSLNWVGQRTEQALLHTCSRQESEQWACFNDNSLDSATNLLLFAPSTIYLYSRHWRQQQDDMYCRQDGTCTICLERIEHILHAWKHENMSWNSFIAEYLKLNRKKTAWMARIVSLLERHEPTVSLLQRRVLYWSLDRARHSIVSLLQWHEQNKPCDALQAWIERQWLTSWLSQSTNRTSPTM